MQRQVGLLTVAIMTLGGVVPLTMSPGVADAAPPRAAGSSYSSTASPLSGSPLGWRRGRQAAELSATGVVAGDRLGIAVAASGDGSVLLVGSNGANNFAGAVYVYTLESDSWVQTAELTASDGLPRDNFGYAVALTADGTTAIVGAFGRDGLKGAVYVFKLTGGTWSQTAELVATDGAPGDYLGYTVAVAGKTGRTVLAGAPGQAGFTGAAYVYDDHGSSWQQTAKLGATDAVADDDFGYSVGLSAKGSSAVVGAYRHNTQTGTAYVFSTGAGGWAQTAELAADDGANYADFGYSVAIDGPGSTVLVGALAKNAGTGAAYIFNDQGGAWTQTTELTASDGVPMDRLGWNVALARSGKTAVVGAYGFAGFTGAAYVFTAKHGGWGERTKLIASDGETFDQFGFTVAVSGNGSTALIGAPARGGFTGAAYVFVR